MIYIFIHVCAISNYRSAFMKLMNSIKSSNLYDLITKIYVVVLGVYELTDEMYKDPKLEVIYNTENTRVYERVTLNFMRAHALKHEENQKYLYLHTKGLKYNGQNVCINEWIDLMLFHLVKNCDTCIKILDRYDACGVNYRISPQPHFSGNFRWANSFHIKRLPLLQNYDWYYETEMWLCNTKAKYVSLHQSPVNHHISGYHWSFYESIVPVEIIQFDS